MSHDRCPQNKNSQCLFCRLRSVSLRVNNACRKRKIKSVELTSIIDALSLNATGRMKVSESFSALMDSLHTNDDTIKTNFFGYDLQCNYKNFISNESNLYVRYNKDDSVSKFTAQQLVDDICKDMKAVHTRESNCSNPDFDVGGSNDLLIVLFVG